MMPEKARMPPIERSNMPLIISTIMPQARMPVCAVSRSTTAALPARGKVVGSRMAITHDQRHDENDEQQLPLGGDADKEVHAARAAALLGRFRRHRRRSVPIGANVGAHAALS